MKDTLRHIGQELVEHSSDAEYSARGTTAELFPYIYAASRRMSLRAISRWLKEAHGVGLTVQSISRAMMRPEHYWRGILDDLEPSARIFAEAHGVGVGELLGNKDLFEGFRHGGMPKLFANGVERYESAAGVVGEWFEYPAVSREECLNYLDEEEGGSDGDEDRD